MSADIASHRGRYRFRTWLRGRLPWSLAQTIPKGADCGAHEFYRASADRDACYHCRVTRRHEPGSASECELVILQRAMRAGSTAAADALTARIIDGPRMWSPPSRRQPSDGPKEQQAVRG
jgi:hypothetical protein